MVQRRLVRAQRFLHIGVVPALTAVGLVVPNYAAPTKCAEWSQRVVLVTISSTDENSDAQLAEERGRWREGCELTVYADRLYEDCETPFAEDGVVHWARTSK